MPNRPDDNEIFDDMERQMLDAVLVMKDVCDMWRVGRRTVEMAIWRGKIVARQSGSGQPYLISRASCERHFGKPTNELKSVF